MCFDPKISCSLFSQTDIFHHFSVQIQYWYQLNRKIVVTFLVQWMSLNKYFCFVCGSCNEMELAFQMQVAICN